MRTSRCSAALHNAPPRLATHCNVSLRNGTFTQKNYVVLTTQRTVACCSALLRNANHRNAPVLQPRRHEA